MKKFVLIVTLLFSMFLVGCTNEESKENGDEVFLKTFETEINTRWKNQSILEGFKEKAGQENINTETVKILENEEEKLSEARELIEDSELKILADSYIEGTKLEVKAIKTEDITLKAEYEDYSKKLRILALIDLVDNYGVKINEEFKDIYEELKESVVAINKEIDTGKPRRGRSFGRYRHRKLEGVALHILDKS